MSCILFWVLSIEEDRINQIVLIIPNKFSEDIEGNEFRLVVIMVNSGRSNEFCKRSMGLDKYNDFAEQKEFSPIVREYNLGRSNEFNQINQTSQIQWSCFKEWTFSCLKCS